MKRAVLVSFTALRPIKLDGTLYQRGDTIPPEVIKAVRKPGVLLSNGWIKAEPDQLNRTRRGGTRFYQPTYLTPIEREAIVVGG